MIKVLDRVFVTPNTLTESSNLLADRRDTRFLDQLRILIEESEEIVVASATAAHNSAFARLGLTDTALLEVISVKRPLITVDLELFSAALAKGEGKVTPTGLFARKRPVEPPLKNPRERTDSGELPAELARQHCSLCKEPFALFVLRSIHRALALSFQVAVALICGLSRPTVRRVRVAPLGAGRSRARFGPTQDSRQNGSLACGVWHSPLPLSVPPVTGFGGAVPPSSGFGRFRHSGVSGNAHKPLTSQEETHYG